MGKFRKGQFVRYRPRFLRKKLIEAIIRRAHRDGTVTLEARFALNKHGEHEPGYLGYRYRVSTRGLHAVAS